jgi:hypothetical protein
VELSHANTTHLEDVSGELVDTQIIKLMKQTEEGFESIRAVLGEDKATMIKYLEEESTPIHNRKPFSTQYANNLQERYMSVLKSKSYIT